MGKKILRNIHPGEILGEEFLKPLGVTAYRLAKDIHVSATRVAEILSGDRSITADTALRFSRYFGTTSKFWMGLQNDYELEEASHRVQDFSTIQKYTKSILRLKKPLKSARARV